MIDYACKICGKIVMSEEHSIKNGNSVIRFCCKHCKDRFLDKTGLKRKACYE